MNIIWFTPISQPKKFGKGGKSRILVDDAFTYVVDLKFSPEEEITREIVKDKASEQIPDDLSVLIWDYIADSGNVQVIALTKIFTDELKAQKLKIEAIEPVSYSLARLVDGPDPTILVYSSERPLLVAVEKKKVVAVDTINDSSISEKNLKNFIKYSKAFFSSEIKKIIISGNLSFEIKPEEDVLIENKFLDPVEGLKKKTDFGGRDEQNLLLSLDSSVHRKISIIPFLLFAILLLAGVFFFFREDIKKMVFPPKKVKIIPTPIIVPTSVPTPTVIEVKKDYTIDVLNGTKISGEAKKVADIFTGLGLNVKNTGNASNSNYKNTIIRYKENVSVGLIDILDTELKKAYTVTREVVSNNTEGSDVIVIIGK